MKFYDCAPAPSPRRVRIFIAEKELDIPAVEVDLRSGEQHVDAFTTINPHRTVPVLELDDGSRITNTAGICAYLEAVKPLPALVGETPLEKSRIAEMQWRMEMQGLMAVSEVLRNRAKAFGAGRSPERPASTRYRSSPNAACDESICFSKSSTTSWIVVPSSPVNAIQLPTSPRWSLSTSRGG